MVFESAPIIIGGGFQGNISEVRIWKEARTLNQIGLYSKYWFDNRTPNLIGLWRLNEYEGQILEDESSTGNDGILGATNQVDSSDPIPSSAPFTRYSVDLFTMHYHAKNKRISSCSTGRVYGNLSAAAGSELEISAGEAIYIYPSYGSSSIMPGFRLSIENCNLAKGRTAVLEDENEAQPLDQVIAYPNPTSGKVMVELLFEPASETLIKVYNAFGKEVDFTFSKTSNTSVYEVDLGEQSSGLYIIRVYTQQGWISKKIVLSK
jgi:hypothetical protein